jgi:VIT1/CCC1 family predicted Fe2+/Mn2+ transporter
MSFQSENLKVTTAALFGAIVPSTTNLFLDGATPVLNFLLLVAQFVVAVVSALYIYSKWKKNRK